MRNPRRKAAAALVAVLTGTGLMLTAAAPAQAVPAGTFAFENYFNHECLTGGIYGAPFDGTPVALEPCNGIRWYDQNWTVVVTSGYTMFEWAADPIYCMDGRLGTGNVMLELCNSDGTHTHYIQIDYQGLVNVWVFEDQFNAECLDGRLGIGNVTLQDCGTPAGAGDSGHEWWGAAPAFTP